MGELKKSFFQLDRIELCVRLTRKLLLLKTLKLARNDAEKLSDNESFSQERPGSGGGGRGGGTT